MSRHDRIPSQLRHLQPGPTDDEVKDRRWWRMTDQHVAEIDLDQVKDPAIRETIIGECKRQNGRTA